MDIQKTISAIAAGDHRQFDDFVRRFEGTVARAVSRCIQDRHAQDDVIQETWCRAYDQISKIEDSKAVEAWLARIAKNCANDHLRREQRRQVHQDAADLSSQDAESPWIWDLVAQMDPTAAEVLRLRYREGRSYAEIAKKLQTEVSTVRGRLYQARIQLRELLENEENS